MAAAAATSSLSLSLDGILAQAHNHHSFPSSSPPTLKKLFLPCSLLNNSSSFHTLLRPCPRSRRTHPPVTCSTSTPSSPQPIPADPPLTLPTTTTFLDSEAADKLRVLEDFRYVHNFPHGNLEVRLMARDEVDATTELIAESYAESLRVPTTYSGFLARLIKEHVLEKRAVLPYAAMLVGFYKPASGAGGEEDEEGVLAATAEIFFDARGSNSSPPPSPPPPRECPYICNMAVRKEFRRRRIGWQLLKSCEELICLMAQTNMVYLHCQMVDKGPFNMYTKAGYRVCNTDTILIWLSLQRRKYLMCKKLDLEDKTD